MVIFNTMKIYNFLLPGLFCFFYILSGINNPDDFVLVLNRVESEALGDKLFQFQSEGIERTVSLENYNAEEVIQYARTYLGTRHKMGGTSKKGIDCSGFIMVVHEKFDIYLPHSANEQARYGEIIPTETDLQIGDLVFFSNSYSTSNPITHSGIYLGEGSFIHTSSSEGVTITSIDDFYWKDKFLFGTRFTE